MNWILLVLVIPLFFLWVFLHEMSHILAVHGTIEGKRWQIKMCPYTSDKGSFRWAGYSYVSKRKPNSKELVMISLAPRIMNLVAVIAFPFGVFFSGLSAAIWFVFWGAGLVDFGIGSIGYSVDSDLRVASVAMGLKPWVLRVAGFSLLVATLLLAFKFGLVASLTRS